MQVTVVVTGLSETRARLVSIGRAFTDFSDEMDDIGDQLEVYFGNDVFISEGEDFGTPWKQLATSTLAYKQRHWDGRGILERSGDLKEGFTHDADKTSVYVTNKVPYFVYHQSDEEPRKKIPRRQMIGVTDKVRTIVHDVIYTGVDKRLRTAHA